MAPAPSRSSFSMVVLPVFTASAISTAAVSFHVGFLMALLLLRLLLSLLLFSSTYHLSLWSYLTQPFTQSEQRALGD